MAEERQMNGMWDRLVHPEGVHPWRWRLLCVWIIVFSMVVGVLLDQHHDQALKAERLAAEAKVQNARQQKVLVQVCNRGYVLLGLIEVAEDIVRLQLEHDQATNPKLAEADEAFLRRADIAHGEIVDELTSGDSPCVKATQ